MSMIHLLMLAVHLLATVAKLLRPGGVGTVIFGTMKEARESNTSRYRHRSGSLKTQ